MSKHEEMRQRAAPRRQDREKWFPLSQSLHARSASSSCAPARLRVAVAPISRGVSISLSHERGFTLIELVITLTVLVILALGVIPLVKNSVKRQKEQRLHETLREIRAAIDQFHREALVAQCPGLGGAGGATTPANPPPVNGPNNPNGQPSGPTIVDPRVKVAISDCKIFGTDNPDRFPPDLDTLVQGVNVVPVSTGALPGGLGNPNVNATDVGRAELSTKKKIYLRSIPIDPMTGKADWDLRSSYDAADAGSWGGENVFNVRSKSGETAFNGEKYSDW